MYNQQTFLRDKPYEFVHLLEQCSREEASNHSITEEASYNGKLILKITVSSFLHIGSKQQDYDSCGNIIKKQMCRNGKIVIPGSSLKGAVRAVAEAVSYSCAVKVPDPVLKKLLPPKNNKSCSDIINEIDKNNKLCNICSIFGMAGKWRSYKGKVSFGEFVLISGNTIEKKIPLLESPFKNYPNQHDVFNTSSKKINYGNERLYYCKACETGNCHDCSKQDFFQNIETAGHQRSMGFRGRKFYSTSREKEPDSRKATCYEMIEPGSILIGEIIFQNLREQEGKLLSYALDLGNHFNMKLGYGKPLGYGKVNIDLESIENIGYSYPTGKKITKDIFKNWGQEYKMECSDEIKEVINELEMIMK